MIQRILSEPTERRRLIDSCQWHKVEIHKRQNNKRRLTLSLTKPQFMKQCAEQTLGSNDGDHAIQLVPILMFNCDTEARWIEHVWIISIEEGVSIGIALRTDGCHGGLRVTGIHLDGDYLRQQHELVLPGHQCTCLDRFESSISDLRIGNPDDLQNKINYYQQVIRVLSQYKEGVKALIKVDPHDLGHFQAVQRQAIEQHGLRPNNPNHGQPVPFMAQTSPQPQRFQRHLTVASRSPQPQRMVQNGQHSPHLNVQNGCGSGAQRQMAHNVQQMAMAQNAHPQQQRQMYPMRHPQLQQQNVQRQHMSIPSGLPNRPSTYFGNCNQNNYYARPANQLQQSQLRQQNQLRQQQSMMSGMRTGCASNAAANPYQMN